MIPRNKLDYIGYASRARLEGPEAYPLHDHDSFGEVFWLDEGSCEHRVNGQKIDMKVGDFVFIRPEDQHSFHSKKKAFFVLSNVCFQWYVYQEMSHRYFPKGSHVYGENLKIPRMVHLDAKQLRRARDAFFNLNSPLSRFDVERYLINFFADLVPLPQEDPIVGFDAPPWLQDAWRMVKKPENLRLGVPAFSRLCGRSSEHVSREFHKFTGQTLTQSINRLRMNYAANLLSGTNKEIVEVALECGYESLSRFYFLFHQMHGLSPLAFRKRSQKRMYPADALMKKPT